MLEVAEALGEGPEEGSDLTVEAYLTEWLSHVGGRVRPSTHRGYAGLIRLYALPALGEVPLSSLRPLHLQRLYASELGRGRSAGTVLNLHLVMTQALNQAVRWGLLVVNPSSGAQPPRPRRAEPALVDQVIARRILDAVKGRSVEVPAAIALATGMRRGEILGLRWQDVSSGFDLAQVRRTILVAQGTLVVAEPKTKRSRRAVALPSFLGPYLSRHKDDQARRRDDLGDRWREHDLVIDRGDGGLLHPDTLSSAWRRFLLKEGMPHVRFHDLRHAHASLMLLQGVHPKVVSERLGHASVGITLDIYSHVLPSMQWEAARAFDRLFAPA